MDVFMKHVLQVPDEWKEVWGPTIEQIKRDKEFAVTRLQYTKLCGIKGCLESTLYDPLVLMVNIISKTVWTFKYF